MTTASKATDNAAFATIVGEISKQKLTARITQLSKGFDSRAAFELTNAPANTAIQKKITTFGNKMCNPAIAVLTIATNVDPNFMNSSISDESRRFNVYAIDKMHDLLAALDTGTIRNTVNQCIVANLFAATAQGVDFTAVLAQASVSDKIKVTPAALAKSLTRHTASASTAPTQSSSTMAALVKLGIVVNKGKAKSPVWTLTDTPQTARLREVHEGKATSLTTA